MESTTDTINTKDIEKKWQEKWNQEKAFEVNPQSGKEKKFITAAFPYPNSPQHIGHARTYTTADIYARYLRMKGYNVLFPMGFHVTGTPILAMAKRIGAKDEDVLSVFESIYGISREKAATLSEPKALVTYFSKEIEQGMKEMGFSIDWRRKFYSYDEKFNKFIQWQFRKMKETGYLVKGEYPIAWCPSDNQAVSAHDTKGDVDPELDEVTLIKFKVSDGTYLVVTTYRPETIYGVTNIWINPKIEYVKVKHENDVFILSKEAANSLDLQWKLSVIGSISPDEILKMTAQNPVKDANYKSIPVLPASFVKADVGTGVVMSVPAHAPLDYLALRDLGKDKMALPQVVSVGGYLGIPAKDIVEKMNVKNQDDPKATEATDELYLKENSGGKMLLGQWAGSDVRSMKEQLMSWIRTNGLGYTLRVISHGPIFCRCGSKVKVNMIKDQWFIDYGFAEWKAKAKECLASMDVIPKKSRSEYEYTIDWLMKRPCTRAAGLGTRFPFDETKMIEALSDSTLYMAFYTIAHLLEDIEPSKMDDQFFDFVFLGKGTGNDHLKKMRESFLYWYPVDSRHSAGDLIRNHLTLYLFIHTALLEQKHWPRQIVTNGFVLMDGMKMSKSMGNILPLRKAIEEYGADVIRFSVVAGAELSSDTDFSPSVASGVKSRLEQLYKLVNEAANSKEKRNHSRMERWIDSRLNKHILTGSKLYSELAMRELALEIFYDVFADLQWYLKRAKNPNLKEFFKKWALLISPIMPHFAEDFYHKLGGSGSATYAHFPSVNEKDVDLEVEMGEDLIKTVHADIEKISGLIGKKPTKVTLLVAASWKRKLYDIARKEKSFEAILKTASASGIPMKDAPNAVKQLMKNIHSLPEILTSESEVSALNDAKEFLSSEFGNCSIEVVGEEKSTHQKAKIAMPGKPAIVLE